MSSVISFRTISGGYAEAEVICSNDDICFYVTEPKTGILRDKGHDLDGVSLAGKILVFPSGKGSAVVQDEGLFSLKENGNLPAAMIIESPETVLVFAALLLKIPLLDSVSIEDRKKLQNGVRLRLDTDKNLLEIV
ncbi:aconitase X swivel domain-containing protein [Dasania marina]|uniref:aconitase X swivel domain-containing protein n=1 Tax=Dasania marina TaxID=471499 RepID=UPI000362B795|nr:DUF126 domain-containing protein [Dasania marina]